MKSELNAGFFFGLILIIALLLRLRGIETLPFYYDEVSAILRARFTGWDEHIEKGIIPDGHPPFVQTFLWLFIKFFGENSYLLKSIFAIAGVTAVYFTYKSGKRLFHSQAGLMAAALLAVAYQPVFWSQQIRPYSFGLASITALLWVFSLIATKKTIKIQHFILFGFLTALNCYIHYFAGLTAITTGIILILFCYKKYPKYIIIAVSTTVLLLLPALPVFVHQFSHKGLGWLGKPELSFFAEHLYVIFSKSWVLLMTVVISLLLFLWKSGFNAAAKKKLFAMANLFAIPLLTGYFYSIFRAPVLQHSVLIFSMPFLLLFLGGISKEAAPKPQYIATILILSGGLYALTIENKYYSVVQKEPYSYILQQFSDKAKQNQTAFYFDGATDVAEFHLERILKPKPQNNRQEIEKAFHFLFPSEGFSPKTIYRLCEMNRPVSLGLISGTNPFTIPMCEDLMGKSANRTYFLGGEYLEFKTTGYSLPVKYQRHYLNQRTLVIKANALNTQKNDMVFFRFSPNLLHAEGEIQTAIFCDGNQIDWRSSKLSDFYTDQHHLGYHVIKLADIPAWTDDCEIHVSVKNEDHYLDGLMEYRVCPGNPYMYEVR